MFKKENIILIFILVSVFFSGCMNKNNTKKDDENNDVLFNDPKVKQILEQQKNDPNYDKIAEQQKNDPNYFVKFDNIVENDNLIYFCKDDACFIDKYIKCEEVQIIKDNLIYVVFGFSEDEQKCHFLLDKKYLNENSLKCLFNRVDLTENVFKNLTGEKNTEKEQQIIKENCREIEI